MNTAPKISRVHFFERRNVLLCCMIANAGNFFILLYLAWINLHGSWPPESLVPGPRPLIGLHFGNEVSNGLKAMGWSLVCMIAFTCFLSAYLTLPRTTQIARAHK